MRAAQDNLGGVFRASAILVSRSVAWRTQHIHNSVMKHLTMRTGISPTTPSWPRLALFISLVLMALVSGCTTLDAGRIPNAIVMPALQAWYEGRAVRYIATDVSHADVARMMGANTASRLSDALPPSNSPGVRNALERVYKFPDTGQPPVFPSIPAPLGPDSRDEAYSPIWRVVEVRWNPGRVARELKSEEQILASTERGETSLAVTAVVINCPVVWVEGQPLLPGTRLVWERALEPN